MAPDPVVSGSLGGFSGESTFSDSSSSSSTAPQILSRSAFPQLIQNLDAGDVLECYQLTRQAKLNLPLQSSSNRNDTLTTTKLAIGLRYQPNNYNPKRPLEFTLEYGPTRFGLQQDREAVPHILSESSSEGFLTYENEANVYYTMSIHPEYYDSAIFMASLTGAVLPSLLEQALRYPMNHPRYQPFAVYQVSDEKEIDDENGQGGDGDDPRGRQEDETADGDMDSAAATSAVAPPKLVLKSSASSDFLQHLWQFLARVRVELEPIIPPPVDQARLYVSNIEKVSGVDEATQSLVSTQASIFYSKLQKCVLALATSDYSEYFPTMAPSLTIVPTTAMPSATSGSGEADENDDGDEDASEDNTDDGNATATSAAPTATPDGKNDRHRRTAQGRTKRKLPPQIEEGDDSGGDDESTSDAQTIDVDGDFADKDEIASSLVPSMTPSGPTNDDGAEVIATNNSSFSPMPSSAPSPSDIDEAAQAQQAADAAKEAAAEAKNAAQSDADSKAADAAQAAANAAQKAADATSAKSSQQAMDAILSGDGTVMSAVLTQCITNPQYEINASHAYLYLDGAYYYKLNLTAPYMDVVRLDRDIPQPPSFASGTGGDFVDWTLAFMLFGLLGSCFLITCQQIGLPIIPPMFRFQKWFFSPRHYEEDALDATRGQGYEHAFGEDVIPLSMGGRRPQHQEKQGHLIVPSDDQEDLFEETNDYQSRGSDNGPVVIELPDVAGMRRTFSNTSAEESHLSRRRESNSSSHHSRRESSGMLPEVPERFSRDPDLVDLPHLVSKTKVAVPVGQRSRGGSSSSSSVDEEEGELASRNGGGYFD